ncbi:MAG: DNA topoisomerase, partial [Vicinamibacteria bacterium]
MARSLVIVESPAKAKTIKKYLGRNFAVEATLGHVKDLPRKSLGVDIENDFAPQYEVIKGKAKVIAAIRKAAEGRDHVYLAPDPDREGEAIAWHIAEELGARRGRSKKKGPQIHRVLVNEITKRGVLEAVSHPLELDMDKFQAQQARRILDRLVGYQISPLLWRKVRRGLSAGRVQSVAVLIICNREKEIQAFKIEEYWTVSVKLEGENPPPFL